MSRNSHHLNFPGRLRRFATCVVAAFASTTAQAGTVLYVDDDATPAGTGLSWDTAYRFLQDALTDASASGGGVNEIRVGQGTYTPDRDELNPLGTGDREATFQLINGVTLSGGYAGLGTPEPDEWNIDLYQAKLSGDLAGDDGPDFADNGENSYNVVTGSGTDETAGLDGFTITAGNANGPDGGPLNVRRGAGIWNLTGSPTINACDVIANRVQWGGAGMYNHTNSSPTVTNCRFEGNAAIDGNGGGMLNNFESNPTITDCDFIGNAAGVVGGGMRNNESNPTIIGCSFAGNTSIQNGGGMFNTESSPTVLNCQFTQNSGFNGGGMRNFTNSNPTIIGCLFAGNAAISIGGGMYNSNSSPTVTNCTFSGNTAQSIGGGIIGAAATINNCIVWANTPNQIQGVGITVNYTDVQGGFAGTDNIDADPLFVDLDNADYRLSPGSPCIDAADNTAVPGSITTDLDGNPRFADDLATADTGNGECPIVDMGAYEFPSSCPWDLDCDANVGITDFLALLAAWGTDPGGPPDFDGDGNVGITDFLQLLAEWGPCL